MRQNGRAAKYLTTEQAAALWGVTRRCVQGWCVAGKIAGAWQFGRSWTIPEDAEPPQYRNRPRTQNEQERTP